MQVSQHSPILAQNALPPTTTKTFLTWNFDLTETDETVIKGNFTAFFLLQFL